MNAWSAWMLLEGPDIALHTKTNGPETNGPRRREGEEDVPVARQPELRVSATAAADQAGGAGSGPGEAPDR